MQEKYTESSSGNPSVVEAVVQPSFEVSIAYFFFVPSIGLSTAFTAFKLASSFFSFVSVGVLMSGATPILASCLVEVCFFEKLRFTFLFASGTSSTRIFAGLFPKGFSTIISATRAPQDIFAPDANASYAGESPPFALM